MFQEIEGDLITVGLEGRVDVIAHGCNAWCVQGAGVAAAMVKAFRTNDPDTYPLEHPSTAGDVNKLGQIQWNTYLLPSGDKLKVVNCYTQYNFGANHKGGDVRPLDYEALTLCLRKMNHKFHGKKVGLPLIGCHLAGGDWNIVKPLIQKELRDCHVTIVHLKL